MKYSIWITLLKFALGAIGGTIYAPLVQWLLDGIQNNNWVMNPDAQALTITLVSAAAAGLYAAGKNWWNNYLVPRMDRIKFMKMLAIGGACGLMIGTQGCMTAGTGTPLAFGKPAKMSTEIKTQMPPEVDPVTGALIPGESYYAKIEKELPAGTDLEGQDNLHFGIGATGDWDITLGQAAGYSSQGQAQGLLEFSKVNAQLQRDQQAQAWGSIMPFLSLVAPEAAALIGKKMDLGAVDDARDDANSAAKFEQAIKLMENISKRLSRVEAAQKPAEPPADSPGVDLPEVGTN